MKYTVKELFDEDYGCEGIPENAEPMVNVAAQSENGKIRRFRFTESYITENKISEGSIISVGEDT